MLTSILTNLRENEALYEDIDVHWQMHYRKPFYGTELQKRLTPRAEDIEGRWVRQGRMFYLNFEGNREGPPNGPEGEESKKIHLQKGFDGSQTRVLQLRHNYVGNIVKGPANEYRAYYPHTIPLRWERVAVPLSTYLSGREAVLAHPWGRRSDVPDGTELVASYSGEEEVNGLHCHKIALEYVYDQHQLAGRREFWLAEDRNYLPIKSVCYNYPYSKEIPIEEATLDDLREIEPGIWFPFFGTITVMDETVLRKEKRPAVSWTREYVVQRVSLNPDYEISFFRNVPFPDGIPVYEVDGGNIVRSYVQGGGSATVQTDNSED